MTTVHYICEFGACGAGPTGFQAGFMAALALGPLAACIAAEPCGTILLGVQKKIVQAQKFLGCRNVNKRNQ